MPFIEYLVTDLAGRGTLVIDVTEVGRCCLVLMVGLVYQRKALPLP